MVQINFLAWLWTRIICAGLQPSTETEKSFLATWYRQFSTNIKINTIKLLQNLLDWVFCPSGLTKLFFFSFSYPRKAVYNNMRLITIICFVINHLWQAEWIVYWELKMFVFIWSRFWRTVKRRENIVKSIALFILLYFLFSQFLL